MIIPHHTIEDPIRGKLIITDAPVSFSVCGVEHTVYAGFVSDGMSVPRFLWRPLAVPDDPTVLAPSVIHDWLYTTHACTRLQADLWYYRALRYNGYPRWKSILTLIGVRIFGRPHWRH